MAFGAAAVGCAVIVAGSGGAAVAAVPIVGVAMSWGAPVQSRFIDSLASDERAAGFGLVRTVYMLLGALGSVVVGSLSDVAGGGVAFGAPVALLGGEWLRPVALGVRGGGARARSRRWEPSEGVYTSGGRGV